MKKRTILFLVPGCLFSIFSLNCAYNSGMAQQGSSSERQAESRGFSFGSNSAYASSPVSLVLIEAARQGNLNNCSELNEKGGSVPLKDEEGKTALSRAAEAGHREICELLIARGGGAQVNEKDAGGDTALMRAAYKGSKEICALLIENGASVHEKNARGMTALMNAVKSGHADVQTFLIEKGAQEEALPDVVDSSGCSGVNSIVARSVSSRAGTHPVSSLSSQPGIVDEVQKSPFSFTLNNALVTAWRSGLREPLPRSHCYQLPHSSFSFLQGASSQASPAPSTITSLPFGKWSGSLGSQSATVSGGTGNTVLTSLSLAIPTPFGTNQPSSSIALGPVLPAQAVQLLVGASEGNTPSSLVQCAVPPDSWISRAVTGFNAGSSSLHRAASEGNEDGIKALITGRACLDVQDDEGMTPLHVAARNGQVKSIEALLCAGAWLEARDKKAMTPLHWASMNGKFYCIEIMIAANVLLDAQNDEGMTPLHMASKSGQLENVECLIKAGALLEVRDRAGRSAVDWAVQMSNEECLRALIKGGAQV